MITAGALNEQTIGSSSFSRRASVWHDFRKQRKGMIGLVTLSLIILAVIFVPTLFPNPYVYVNPDANMWHAPVGQVDPTTGHLYLLGTDTYGHDNFALLFQGGRLTLTVAIIPAVLVMLIGFLIGAFTGYYGGWIDTIVMRLVDFLLALPLLPAYIISLRIIRADNGDLNDEVWNLMLALVTILSFFGWPKICRLIRGLTITLRNQQFIEATRALGASNARIIFRHIFPNTFGPLLIAGLFAFGDFVVLEAILSYVGLSFHNNPPGSSFVTWGNLLAGNENQIWRITNLNPFQEIRGYLAVFPCLLIMLTMVAVNFMGDALLIVLNPRRSK